MVGVQSTRGLSFKCGRLVYTDCKNKIKSELKTQIPMRIKRTEE